ncbi:MAG: hypothetical protein HC780_03045 [Leptolyngbyaceae cyanobacterium CSU_1_3]|nr:hypothetical protein [Leptolyngbyaceae cyanobacterium CSU_1_3]
MVGAGRCRALNEGYIICLQVFKFYVCQHSRYRGWGRSARGDKSTYTIDHNAENMDEPEA